MTTITTNCPGCMSPLELVVPNEVLRVIKEEAIVKFTCISCSKQFMIKLIFSPPKKDSKISDSKPESIDDESKEFYPLKPRPQIRDIEEISKSSTIANVPNIFARKL